MNWSESIDLYCERTDPGLWSEPLNAFSNLGFVVAAMLLWRLSARPMAGDRRLLIGLIAAVGLGSFCFHTLATRWAAVLDVAFIALFVLAYYQRFQVRVLERSNRAAWIGVILFVLGAAVFAAATRALPPLPLNGSEIYLPPFALLLLCARQAGARHCEGARWLGWASGLFLVSLSLRCVDQALCAIWPLGTHLGWHLVNALVLYACMAALPQTTLKPPVPAPPRTGQ